MNDTERVVEAVASLDPAKPATIYVALDRRGKNWVCTEVVLYKSTWRRNPICRNKDDQVTIACERRHGLRTMTRCITNAVKHRTVDMYPFLCDITAPGEVYQAFFVQPSVPQPLRILEQIPRTICGCWVFDKHSAYDLEPSDWSTEHFVSYNDFFSA